MAKTQIFWKITYKKNFGFFGENRISSLFYIYNRLTCCKKSEKSNERKYDNFRHWLTDRLTDWLTGWIHRTRERVQKHRNYHTKDHPAPCQGQMGCLEEGIKWTNKQTRKENSKGGCGYANHPPACIIKFFHHSFVRYFQGTQIRWIDIRTNQRQTLLTSLPFICPSRKAISAFSIAL